MYNERKKNIRKAKRAALTKAFNTKKYFRPEQDLTGFTPNRKERRDIWKKAKSSYDSKEQWRSAWVLNFTIVDNNTFYIFDKEQNKYVKKVA